MRIKIGSVALVGNLHAATELQKRILSALLAAGLCLGSLFYSLPLFYCLVVGLIVGMLREWWCLTSLLPCSAPSMCWVIRSLGSLYIILGASIFLLLEPLQVAWILMLVWLNDTFAYISGRLVGGPKLWPQVSPNKTWAGLMGGVLGGVLVSVNVLVYTGVPYQSAGVLYGIATFLSVAGHGGDLIESAFKRYVGVKDSGTIMPGHGGLLDRLDSLLMVGLMVWALWAVQVVMAF